MLPSKKSMLILSAIIGGCAFVGMFVLAFIGLGLVQGPVNPSWVPKLLLGLFVFGGALSSGMLWLILQKIEKNIANRILKGFQLDE